MARTLATLPEGARITDYISLGVISKAFPMAKVKKILKEGAGTQFDPKIVKVFLEILKEEK